MAGKIVVGVDGSEGARRAAEFAAKYAKRAGASVVVVHVIEWSEYAFYTPEELAMRHAERESELDRAQADVVKPVVDLIRKEGIEVTGLVRHGHASQIVCDLVEELDADHVVIGRRGHSRVARLLFGSVASGLIQSSPVAVTVVP